MSDVPAATASVQDGPVGIGGWLILPMLGILGSPLSGFAQLGTYLGLGESFPFLSGPQQVFIIAEAIGVVALSIVVPIILLVLLLQKKRAFPRVYVIWAVVNISFIFLDLVGAKILFGHIFEAQGIPFFDSETLKSIVQAVALIAIWTPYMLQSRRIANTFVN